jgi:hypothetical protein
LSAGRDADACTGFGFRAAFGRDAVAGFDTDGGLGVASVASVPSIRARSAAKTVGAAAVLINAVAA